MLALRENHEKLTDPKQKHLEYEACEEHGMFMDAGEFTDYKYETLLDLPRCGSFSRCGNYGWESRSRRAARLAALLKCHLG